MPEREGPLRARANFTLHYHQKKSSANTALDESIPQPRLQETLLVPWKFFTVSLTSKTGWSVPFWSSVLTLMKTGADCCTLCCCGGGGGGALWVAGSSFFVTSSLGPEPSADLAPSGTGKKNPNGTLNSMKVLSDLSSRKPKWKQLKAQGS